MTLENGLDAFSLTEGYKNIRKSFGIDVLEDSSLTQKEKLEELVRLSQEIKNKNDSLDFEKLLSYEVKTSNPELYKEYQDNLKNSLVNQENNPSSLVA